MEVLVLAAVILLALVMIPFSLRGTWVIAAAAAVYRILVPTGGVGWFTVACVTILATLGAVADLALAGRYARKYGARAGARSSAGWSGHSSGFRSRSLDRCWEPLPARSSARWRSSSPPGRPA